MKTYNTVSRINHWGIAMSFIAMLMIGSTLAYVDLAKPTYFWLLGVHKATGILLLVWAIYRVAYRLIKGFPEPASALSAWEAMLSKTVHYALLLAIVGMPVSGLIMALYSGFPTDVFGLFTIPSIEKVETISGTARSVHKWMAYLLLGSLIAHLAGALKHHMINRDATLVRMVTGRTTRRLA